MKLDQIPLNDRPINVALSNPPARKVNVAHEDKVKVRSKEPGVYVVFLLFLQLSVKSDLLNFFTFKFLFVNLDEADLKRRLVWYLDRYKKPLRVRHQVIHLIYKN